MMSSIEACMMWKMNASVDVTCRLPKKNRDTVQVALKKQKVNGIRLEVPRKAVGWDAYLQDTSQDG